MGLHLEVPPSKRKKGGGTTVQVLKFQSTNKRKKYIYPTENSNSHISCQDIIWDVSVYAQEYIKTVLVSRLKKGKENKKT